MIAFENFTFAGPPRCATTWVLAVCRDLGLKSSGWSCDSAKHIPDTDSNSFRVSTVRHPCQWLRSVYHSIRGGLIGNVPFDSISVLAREVTEKEFLQKYLESDLTVAAVFDQYQASSCLRVEDLPWALFEHLKIFTSIVKYDDVSYSSPINARKEKIRMPVSTEIRRAIFDKERELYERFEYVP